MDIEIELLPVQREFLQSTEDFVAIVSSRSCGKTWVAVLDALIEVLKGNNILYMCQNDGAWYKGGWVHLQAFLQKWNLLDDWSWNSTYKTGTLRGKKWYVGTYENVDGARGATECSTLYLDEFMLSKPSVMAAVAPCLRGKDEHGNDIVPRIRAVSTPNMQSLWQVMIVEHDKYGIKLLRSKLTDNVFITEKQRQVMANAIFDEKLRRQEIDGEIILGEDSTAIMALQDFPTYLSNQTFDQNVYGGLDMAHTGLRDGHVFAAIKGNELVAFHEFGMADSFAVCKWIREFNKAYKLKSIDMDLAWSESVFDQLKFEIPCRQVAFSEKAPTDEAQRQYMNIRAYGYFKLARLHRSGLFVDTSSQFIDSGIVAEYKKELVNTHFVIAPNGKLLIEPKEDIKMRIGRSPDPADALMLACLNRGELDDPKIRAKTLRGVTRDEEAEIMSEL